MGNSPSRNFFKAWVDVKDEPKKKEGVKPSKHFNIKDHLKACQHNANPSTIRQTQPDKLFTLSNILNSSQLVSIPGFKQSEPICIKEQSWSYPFSSVGLVVGRKLIKKEQVLVIGSGCLIGPRLVLTCLHNCYDAKTGSFFKGIEFIPAPIVQEAGSGQHSGTGFQVLRIFLPDIYQQVSIPMSQNIKKRPSFDYALLLLSTDIDMEEYFGSISYNFDWQEDPPLVNQTVLEKLELVGFRKVANRHQLSLLKCEAVSMINYALYNIKTQPEWSGSPLLQLQQNGLYRVIAIHAIETEAITTTQNHSIYAGAALKLRGDMIHLMQIEHRYYLSYREVKVEKIGAIAKEIQAQENKLWKESGTYQSTVIDLRGKMLGEKGCQFISSIKWKQLTNLQLADNKIGNKGCQHLSRVQWKELTNLSLERNMIGELGCLHISRGEWQKLKTLNLKSNNIEEKGCYHISRGQWKKLTLLCLEQNNIRDKGCQHIARGEWNQLTTLNLAWNTIGDQGCSHLSRGKWKELAILNLRQNYVKQKGCHHITRAQWPQLRYLNLKENKIQLKGARYLSQGLWPCLGMVDLWGSYRSLDEKAKRKIKNEIPWALFI